MGAVGDSLPLTPRAAPLVSVCMITYKHEAFIAQAIDSVISQQTDFPIELVIGEDNSPDATAAVIQRYQSNARVSVRARFNRPNLGMQANFELTLQECSGKYVALLEGDDYWTDPKKLQRQVDVLEASRDLAICFHPVDVLTDQGLQADTRTREVPADTGIEDLALGNYMHTCSVMFRRGLFTEFPPSFKLASAGDFFLHMLNARFGRIRRLPQKMAVYRVHGGGLWSGQADVDLKILNYLECMIGLFDDRINDILIQRYRETAVKSFLTRLDEPGAEQRIERCLRYGAAHFADRVLPLVKLGRSVERHRLSGLLKRLL